MMEPCKSVKRKREVGDCWDESAGCMWDDVRTDVSCMRWYVPKGNVGIGFTEDARRGDEGGVKDLLICENMVKFVKLTTNCEIS